jgi:PHP family Zn ribbon phosphoesterase
LTYENLAQALRIPFPTPRNPNRIAMTVEFFPEEGMYHWDGHRAHDVRLSPAETKKRKGICPRCGAKVTVGVLHRVDDLADRPDNFQDPKRPPYKSLVPLMEIIGESLNVGKLTKTVEKVYDQLVDAVGPEFKILLEAELKDLAAATDPRVVEAIKRVRQGKLEITPGYDGVYGTVKIFSAADRQKIGQSKLF